MCACILPAPLLLAFSNPASLIPSLFDETSRRTDAFSHFCLVVLFEKRAEVPMQMACALKHWHSVHWALSVPLSNFDDEFSP